MRVGFVLSRLGLEGRDDRGRVAEVGVAGLAFGGVEIIAELLGDEPVEEPADDVGLKVPPVEAAPQAVGNLPDRLV
jgi:hypothetical protein